MIKGWGVGGVWWFWWVDIQKWRKYEGIDGYDTTSWKYIDRMEKRKKIVYSICIIYIIWFARVRECPRWCSIVDAKVTVHQFFCILHYIHYSSSKSVAFLYEIVHLKKNLLVADIIIQGISLKNDIDIYLVRDKLDSFSACCNILIAFKNIVISSVWLATSTHISFWKMIIEEISIQRAAA